MSAEPCARCGHAYEHIVPRKVPCLHRDCDCPGYMTAGQRAAWEFAADAVKPYQTRERMRVALHRLMEAYP